jgi:hypothetical protein
MFIIGINLSETILGGFILNSNRDRAIAFFLGISLIYNSSFSNKQIFYVSEPPRNQVR